MAQAEVGALRVRLAMDAGEFTKGAKIAENRIASFTQNISKRLSALRGSIALLGTSFAALGLGMVAGKFRETITEMDKMIKLSRSIGVPVEQFTALRHAAEMSGMTVEQLGSTFRNVARNMHDAAMAPSEFSRSLDALGVSWRDAEGNFRRADELMLDVADKFAKMEDGAGKTALAMKIFGEEMGPKMINLLNNGSASIREMMAEADRLGIVIQTKTATAAEQFNDTLDKVSKANQGVTYTIIERLLPTLNILADAYLEWSKNSNAAGYAAEVLNVVLKGLATTVSSVATLFSFLGTIAKTVASAILSVAQGELTEAINTIKNGWTDATATVQEQITFLNNLWRESVAEQAEVAATHSELVAAPVVQSTKSMVDAQREYNEAMREGQRIMEELRSPYEVMIDTQARLNELYRMGAIDADTLAKASSMAANVMKNAYASAASSIGNALTQVFEGNKGVAIATALINTYEAYTRALANPPGPPFSYAQAAAALAAGFAQVSNIRKTTKSGSGGSSSASAPDSAPAAAPTQQAGATHTLFVSGIDPNQLYSGAAMRDLFEAINQHIADGGRLVLA